MRSLWRRCFALWAQRPFLRRRGKTLRVWKKTGGSTAWARVALASALEEQLGLPFGDNLFAQVQTLADLRALASGGRRGVAAADGPANTPRAHANDAPVSSAATAPAVAEHTSNAPRVDLAFRYATWTWTFPARAFRAVFQELFARPLTWLLGAPRVQRETRATADTQGPLLLIANHVTAMDVPLVLYALPRHLRLRVAVMMAGEMLRGWEESWRAAPKQHAGDEHCWWGPLAAPLLRLLFNVFPLPRASGFRDSFAHAGRWLDRGMAVLLFPEGHRVREAALGPFRPGLGLLVQEAEVPVLPIAIGGLKGQPLRRFRPKHLAVRVGEPLHFERGTMPELITQRLQEVLEQMLRDM